MKEKGITIFCDGASKGNPGPGGYGAILIADGKVKELGGAEKNTTNNRMELMAAITALKEIGKGSRQGGTLPQVDIYTDSRYVINGITKWVHAWQKNGWQTKAKEDVVNKDLWEKLAKLVQPAVAKSSGEAKKINWHYVGGHIGVAGNERCDEIASALASGEKVDLYEGSLNDYEIDVLDLGHDAGKKESKTQSKKSNSKVKAYSYVSLVNGILNKDQTWAECEKRVKGKSGAKFKKAISAEDEAEIIGSWGL